METKHGRVNVSDVLKIPELATNLLSVSTICKRDHKVVFTASKWYKRLGHLNEGSLKKLKKEASRINFENEALIDSVSCLEGKQARLPFPTSDSKPKDLLELAHSDLCGSVEVPSFGGSRIHSSRMVRSSERSSGRKLSRLLLTWSIDAQHGL